MKWIKRVLHLTYMKIRSWNLNDHRREVYIRENNTPLGIYYGAVLYDNGYYVTTIGMETYDKVFIENLRETWEKHGTY